MRDAGIIADEGTDAPGSGTLQRWKDSAAASDCPANDVSAPRRTASSFSDFRYPDGARSLDTLSSRGRAVRDGSDSSSAISGRTRDRTWEMHSRESRLEYRTQKDCSRRRDPSSIPRPRQNPQAVSSRKTTATRGALQWNG